MDRPTLESVTDLADAAQEADGVAPLSEATLLSLAADPSDRDLHGFVPGDGRLDAYSHLRLEDDGTAWAEIVVHPGARRRGLGGRFLDFVLDRNRATGVWAHGDLPAAQAFAAAKGLLATRDLWRMARATDAEPVIEWPTPPDGFAIRHFEPGRDEEAWLGVNGRAFAHHPEQGRMTLDDLHQRMAESWFDPAGLVLIEDVRGQEPVLAASHWTKIADPGDGEGEVYVVAVDPAYQGHGLGRTVTAAGLAHLKDRGVRTIDLYVEGDNDPAIATYRRWGFERVAQDVMYHHT